MELAPGLSFGSVSYQIAGPDGFARSGSFDVSASGTVSAVIGGLPAGTGYIVTLTATSTSGGTQCTGSAPFSITAGATANVTIHLLCREAPTTGSVTVNGTINICPLVDGLSASPAAVQVGGSIALAGAAHDTDAAPAALTYLWTASGGTLSDATAQNPTFTCAAAGSVTVTLAVSDGDCGDSASTTVTCIGGGVAHVVINEVESNGDPVGDWVELTNIGTTTADISGYKLKDNDDTHAFVVVPSGTTLAPGGYFFTYVFQTFGLGAPDEARLFDPAGNLIDSYSWTTHATGTYSRCPNGTGPFIDTTPTQGAANACSGGGAAGAGGSGAAGGAGGLAANELPWPGTDTVITVDDVGGWASNLSGLSYQPATATAPASPSEM